MPETQQPAVQTAFAPLDASTKQFMEDIITEYLSSHEEDGVNFTEAVNDFYQNLMDDLHDSRGDAEYQAGNLERMAFVEQFLGAFLEVTFTLQQKQEEAPWFQG